MIPPRRVGDRTHTEARRRNRGWGNVTVNADETLIVGLGYDPDGKVVPRVPPKASPMEDGSVRLGRQACRG